MNKNVLVTGGAGYIGSHAVLSLHEAGYDVFVIDNLSTGNRRLVSPGARFTQGEAGDQNLVSRVIRENNIRSVMHFAGSIVVEESVRDPLKYYRNNTLVSLNLIETCIREKVANFIFSSTAAVYGNPERIPVTEDAPVNPINPYGQSKAMTEYILKDISVSNLEFNYIILRYFNVSGADPGKRAGQLTKQATHLIKVACELAMGKRTEMTIFGNDYDTADGTCVRDFIHVSDLADIHVLALEYLNTSGYSQILNCGYGKGYSVKEVLSALQELIGKTLNINIGERRPGDPAILVSSNEKLMNLINWKPKYNDIKKILTDSLAWENNLV
jgi:UDP-glucose 4-epimerase